MKKLIPVLACIILALACSAARAITVSEDYFPDPNFREYISTYMDADHDGVLSDGEIGAADYMDCAENGIRSLEGMRSFISAPDF